MTMTADAVPARDPKGTIPVFSAFTAALEAVSPNTRAAVGYAALRRVVDYFAKQGEQVLAYAEQAIAAGEKLEAERDAAIARADRAETALARVQAPAGVTRPAASIGDLRARLGGAKAVAKAPAKTRGTRTLSPTRAVPKSGAKRPGRRPMPRDEFGNIIRSNGLTQEAPQMHASAEGYDEHVVVPNEE